MGAISESNSQRVAQTHLLGQQNKTSNTGPIPSFLIAEILRFLNKTNISNGV